MGIKKTTVADLILFVVISFFTILAVTPLLQKGFIPTHDGEYHLIRFFEFEKMLKNGYWFPRWASGLNSGYGVPLFNFHYPLPNYVGVLFHSIGFSLADSFKLTLATGYISAVVFCFFWLTKISERSVAAAGTIVFAYIPYWFVDIYVRGAIGEVLATSWLMLAMAGIERGWIMAVVVAVAGIVLSHNILSLMYLPFILGYILLKKPVYWWLILVSLGLSAYFWIPAVVEQNYVVGLNTVNYLGHFPMLYQLLIPSWGTGFSGSGDLANEMSYQIGLIPLGILVLGTIFTMRQRISRENRIYAYAILIAAGSIFLTLSYSASIWRLIPIIQYVQYPWRFLSVLLPTCALLSVYVFTSFKRKWLIWGITLFAVVLTVSYSRPVIYAPRTDSYYLTKSNFTDGTSSMGNTFSTKWADWKPQRTDQRIELLTRGGKINNIISRPLEYAFSVTSTDQATVRVNTVYFPGWVVTIDGKECPIDYKSDGTIRFTVPGGLHTVKVVFMETPVRYVADLISLVSLFWLLGWFILKRYR